MGITASDVQPKIAQYAVDKFAHLNVVDQDEFVTRVTRHLPSDLDMTDRLYFLMVLGTWLNQNMKGH